MTAGSVNAIDSSLRQRAGTRVRKAALFKQLGPGLITGAADDDPSGIATYSQAGAQFGFNMLWTMALTYPLMTAVQLVSAQIGRVTGCGLAKNIGDIFPKPFVLGLVGLLFIANTINIGANLAAMGAATQLAVGGPSHLYTVSFALVSLALQMFIPYEAICPLPQMADARAALVCGRRLYREGRLGRGCEGDGRADISAHR